MSYLHNISKEQASYWAADTHKLNLVSTAHFKFPVIPRPKSQTWARVEGMHKWALELGVIAVVKLNAMLEAMNIVCPDDSLPLHERISTMYNHYKAEGKACPLPGRNTFNFFFFLRASYLKEIDPRVL
jgi:hypothetical protein